MQHDGLAHSILDGGTPGNRDAVRLALPRHDLDQVIIRQHVGEFEQRLRHFDRVVGELDDHHARGAVERREQLGHVGPRLDLDQFGQLAQHLVVLGDLLGQCRTRADEGHLATHDVDEVWQLVERPAPQEPADASDSRVALVDRHSGAHPFRPNDHRAQLHDLEGVPVQARSALPVEHRPAAVELDSDCANRDHR